MHNTFEETQGRLSPATKDRCVTASFERERKNRSICLFQLQSSLLPNNFHSSYESIATAHGFHKFFPRPFLGRQRWDFSGSYDRHIDATGLSNITPSYEVAQVSIL